MLAAPRPASAGSSHPAVGVGVGFGWATTKLEGERQRTGAIAVAVELGRELLPGFEITAGMYGLLAVQVEADSSRHDYSGMLFGARWSPFRTPRSGDSDTTFDGSAVSVSAALGPWINYRVDKGAFVSGYHAESVGLTARASVEWLPLLVRGSAVGLDASGWLTPIGNAMFPRASASLGIVMHSAW